MTEEKLPARTCKDTHTPRGGGREISPGLHVLGFLPADGEVCYHFTLVSWTFSDTIEFELSFPIPGSFFLHFLQVYCGFIRNSFWFGGKKIEGERETGWRGKKQN